MRMFIVRWAVRGNKDLLSNPLKASLELFMDCPVFVDL